MLERAHRFLHRHPPAAPGVVLVLAVAVFSLVAGDRFLHPFNLSLVLHEHHAGGRGV